MSEKNLGYLVNFGRAPTTYDSTGRIATTSTPYFSIDPDTTQGVASTRAGTLQPGTAAPGTASAKYDAVDRATDKSHPEELANTPSDSKWDYSTLTTTATNPRGYKTQQTKNARDEVMRVVAPEGQSNALTVNYTRDAVGNLTGIQRQPGDGDSAGMTIATGMGYDRLGRKTSLSDPDKGNWTYQYNALGELTSQTDAKGQTRNLYRDALGRLYERTENRKSGSGFVSEPTSTWEYDTAVRPGDLNPALQGTILLGLLATESNGIGGYSRSIGYDDVGRVKSTASTLDGTVYTERQTYDQFSRPYQHFDASTDANSPYGELTEYSDDGYPIGTREAADGTTGAHYDEVLGLSQRGQVTEERHHDNAGLDTLRTYDDNTGRVLSINTGANALQNWSYDYDRHSNVLFRWNRATGYNLKESFTYDNLDRLHTTTLAINGTSMPALTVGYDQLGNLTSKTYASTSQYWTYGQPAGGCAGGPHAATSLDGVAYCYDANGNQTSADYGGGHTRDIVYTGYDLPASIATNGYPSNANQSFAYAPDRSMWKRVDGVTGSGNDNIFCNGFDNANNTCPNTSGGTTTTYFVGNAEFRVSGGTTTTKRYIGGYLVVTTTSPNATPSYAYLLRDALGSIDVVANENGNVIQRQSFDAWGNRRDASASGGWGLLSPGTAAAFDTSVTYQGFTGHQQLDAVGLIHMKGRLYDPVLGRFIQADPMTESDPTQGLNRYSYVLNNPMSLTDPSGYLSFRQWVGLAIAIVASIVTQQYWIAGDYWASFAVAVAGGFASAYVATGSLRAGLWGAFAAGVFFGIGAGFSQFQGAAGTGFAGSGYPLGHDSCPLF